MAKLNCPFCERMAGGQPDDACAVAFDDAFPVARGHRLVVPRRHVARLEELDADEWRATFELVRSEVLRLSRHDDVDAVNIGVNSGPAAGQTVDHAHVHVIPRRHGDVPDPRGGVRWVIPAEADYWSQR